MSHGRNPLICCRSVLSCLRSFPCGLEEVQRLLHLLGFGTQDCIGAQGTASCTSGYNLASAEVRSPLLLHPCTCMLEQSDNDMQCLAHNTACSLV